jgi:hypothetical protein
VSRAAFLVGVVVAHLGAIAGCYEPELRDCTVQCARPSDCTGGQICRDDGWCVMPGVGTCPEGGGEQNQTQLDASVTSDDADNTAQLLCQMGCTNGTCAAGTCVIDCSNPSSCNGADVKCPANIPCRVVCGERSCAKKVRCLSATSCEVQCNGDYSCQDDIECNSGRCAVQCVGASSCKQVKCSSSCACDVTCSGANSCISTNECPALSCRLGEGCSSLLVGCDKCS